MTGSIDAGSNTGSIVPQAAAWRTEWLEWLVLSRGRAPKTVRMYGDVVRWWLEHLDGAPLDGVTFDEIEGWLQRPRQGRARGSVAAAATQHRDVASLRSFYGWLVSRGVIHVDPTLMVSTPTIRNVQPRPLSDEQFLGLWHDADASSTIALGLGFFCGLRREELTRLRVSHVDLAGRRLVNFVRKGGGEDTLPVGTVLDVFAKRLPHLDPEPLWGVVTARALARDGGDWLLDGADLGARGGGQLQPHDVNTWLDRLTRGTAHVHPHQLRHSCATNLLRAGVPLPMVATLLNHANIQTTMRYCKQGGDELKEWLDSGR